MLDSLFDYYVPPGVIFPYIAPLAPPGWLLCQGEVLPAAQYPILFALFGDTFGGDGVTTFALPDLRGRVFIGSSPDFALASAGGSTEPSLPAHNHTLNVTSAFGDQQFLAGNLLAGEAAGATALYKSGSPDGVAATSSIGMTGIADVTNANMQPYLTGNWIIRAC